MKVTILLQKWKRIWVNGFDESGLSKVGSSVLPNRYLSNVRECVMRFLNFKFSIQEIVSGLEIRSLVFWANCVFFAKKWANERFVKKSSDSLYCSFLVSDQSGLLIFGERPEQFAHSAHLSWAERDAHGRSVVMSDLSDSLTVAHLYGVTCAICSQMLICL